MPDAAHEVVVIGAGQAGLGISNLLKRAGMEHVVLEQERIGQTWRTQRWDSFVLNSPNRFNILPGDTYRGGRPDGFDSAKDFFSYLEGYAKLFNLPVVEHARVVSVERKSSSFVVTANVRGVSQNYACRAVVVASGGMNQPQIPPFARNIPEEVTQYHAATYRKPSDLPAGAVLVVGSAQSGLQLTEELIEAGRQVYLSTSAVGRVPRRYRDRDILDWLLTVGFYDMKTEDIADPKELELRPPQVSGVGPRGHTHSLQSLAKKGAVILGRIDNADANVVSIQPNAADHVRFSDEVSRRLKGLIDKYIMENRLDVVPPEPDPADAPDTAGACASPLTSLDLRKESIRSIVWATGFSGDFRYLRGQSVDGNGRPQHRNGIASIPGLYFIGLPWLRKRKSGIVCGIIEDAEFIADQLKPGSSG